MRTSGCPDRSDPMAAPGAGNLSVGRPRRRPFPLEDETRDVFGKRGVGGSNGLFLFASSSRKGASACAVVRAAQEREGIRNSLDLLDVLSLCQGNCFAYTEEYTILQLMWFHKNL
jgi:hypothetical protein